MNGRGRRHSAQPITSRRSQVRSLARLPLPLSQPTLNPLANSSLNLISTTSTDISAVSISATTTTSRSMCLSSLGSGKKRCKRMP